MDMKLLEAAARTGRAIVVIERPDIEAFLTLRAAKLIEGVLYIFPTGVRYATIHGPTPDGRALLALKRCLCQRSPTEFAPA